MVSNISFPGLSIGPFAIDPVATPEGFPLTVRWYAIMIMTGMILGVAYALYRAKKSGYSVDELLDYVIFAIPAGIVCARLYYVVFNLSDYKTFYDVIAIWNGGIAIYGAIIGGVLTIFIVSRVKKKSFFEVCDFLAPAVMIGQICGRWGNFFNAEAYGSLEKINFPFIGDIMTPFFENDYVFRMMIENQKVGTIEVHPTFLYESFWNLCGLILIHFIFSRKKFDGEIAALYFSWYGFGRFFIEGLRTDSLMSGSFRFSQVLGAVFAVAGIVFIIIGRKLAKKKNSELDNYVKCFEDDSATDITENDTEGKGE